MQSEANRTRRTPGKMFLWRKKRTGRARDDPRSPSSVRSTLIPARHCSRKHRCMPIELAARAPIGTPHTSCRSSLAEATGRIGSSRARGRRLRHRCVTSIWTLCQLSASSPPQKQTQDVLQYRQFIKPTSSASLLSSWGDARVWIFLISQVRLRHEAYAVRSSKVDKRYDTNSRERMLNVVACSAGVQSSS